MGMLGAAFGIGFVFGPPIGGVLVELGGNLLLGLVSFAMALANALFILRALPESHKPTSESEGFHLSQLMKALTVPCLGALLLLYFAYNFGFSNMESTFVSFANLKFGFEQLQSGVFLGIIGIMIAITQGLLVGPLSKRWGERNLARFGVLLVAPSLALIPYMPTVAMLLFGSMFLCFGSGISMPSVQSLISRSAAGNIQGGVFGITQGLGALARILGPLSGQTAFAKNYHLPYLIAGGVVMVPVLIAWFVIPKEGSHLQENSAAEFELPE
jgi:MFS family permease